jgi:polysaccharide pyruvyl transferase CsaB
MSRRQILLSGSYGTLNVGDDAILAVLVNELVRRDCDVGVLTYTPEATKLRHPAARVVRSGVLRGLPGTVTAIRDADMLVVGGGGIIQDATSLGNLLFHLSRPLLARLLGTPFMLAGIGVGPLNSLISKTIVRWVCNAAASVEVRDGKSRETLTSLGAAHDRIQEVADFAHLLVMHEKNEMDRDGRTLIDTLRRTKQASGPLIGLSLRPAVGGRNRRTQFRKSDESQLRQMAEIANRLVDVHGAHVVFISMHPEQDDLLARELAKQIQRPERFSMISGNLPAATIKTAVAEMDLLLGMRLHSIIFAASAGVIPVGFAYDQKVAAYLQSLGLSRQVLPPGSWEPAHVLKIVEQSFRSADRIRDDLRRAMPDRIAEARRSLDRIVELARAGS